ncbi:ABC transporter ATP-binding protein/permease [Paenibacillus oenotherae]|uniref:ABC transporter ATP-binding protein/permease n=1 Tax=Paenibacillus oenotherae TaxID=1435645 RepID=A0ABS7DCW2_9BACL|nr:ABC transporter ATP-binding protein [Paenibacillus oenotherae]MBW7477342.1 ABC transporter ATP-binding protein/permease [Paenibacillus oenotherae]
MIESTKIMGIILSFVKPYRLMATICILGAFFGTGVDIVQANLLKEVVDHAIGGDKQGFIAAVTAIILVIAASCLIRYGIKYYSGHLGIQILRDVRSRLAGRLGRLPAACLENRHSGDIITRMNNDVGSISGFVDRHITNMIYLPLVITGVAVYLLYFNWKLLIVSIILLPVSMLASHKLGRAVGKYATELQESFARYSAAVQDTTGGIALLKSYNMEPVMFGKFKRITEDILAIKLKTDWRCMYIAPISMVVGVVPQMSCILYGGYLTVHGVLTPGELLTFIYLLGFLIGPLSGIPGLIIDFKVTIASARRVIELLEEPEERQDGSVFAPPENGDTLVEFRNVSFSYGEGEPALRGLNLTMRRNRITALAGPSGSGKSTVAKLLCGQYDGYDGDIYIYGSELHQWSLSEARARISIVSQDTYLFPCSIYENIAYGRRDASREEVMQAASLAGADEFIRDLPQGYETAVGERGAALSGGQRQRIAIARAILKDAPIVILDEPTSALDGQSEALVQEALERIVVNRTVLIIAHRLSTIRDADEIVVMNNGQLVEQGGHEELIGTDSLYRQLYNNQYAYCTEGGE